MPSYVVERYVPRLTANGLHGWIEHERGAMAAIEAEKQGVRHVRTTYLREDELCLSLYVGPSAAVVRRANERADLPFERISEAIDEATNDDAGSGGG